MSRKSRFTPLLPALLAVSLLSGATPLPAQTVTPDPETAAGPKKVFMYLGCAVAVFASNSVPALLLALAGCGKMVVDETRGG